MTGLNELELLIFQVKEEIHRHGEEEDITLLLFNDTNEYLDHFINVEKEDSRQKKLEKITRKYSCYRMTLKDFYHFLLKKL
ncbi:hypothetical protein ACEN4B_07865 [Marinilactibacillus psychrotolerans]|uniref:hypothetical protein n=1 Tax=Marinilactibacillus psychrotolerans TaxID=191770 RepID=UPI0038881D06